MDYDYIDFEKAFSLIKSESTDFISKDNVHTLSISDITDGIIKLIYLVIVILLFHMIYIHLKA